MSEEPRHPLTDEELLHRRFARQLETASVFISLFVGLVVSGIFAFLFYALYGQKAAIWGLGPGVGAMVLVGGGLNLAAAWLVRERRRAAERAGRHNGER